MTDWGGLLDKGLGKLEDGWDATKKAVGEGVDKTTDGIGAALDYVGAHDWADKVEDWGDDVGSDLGASISEQQLGQTEQANELIHGKASAIRESTKHLTDFKAAFDRVGEGMKALAAALAHAPAEPPPSERALAGIGDYYGAEAVELNHFVGGVVKGTAGLLNFARGLNPMDRTT
ncbi:putative T7SS-secreted protein [Streptomyces sp. XY332]|uniref:putative T7SS-secreted protein n=1 Tax=Streptomyces sp. XY332 TaxID=1415561 RepID=UPI0006B1E3FD|nr:hypothetical protein [Streptomyces sp. XY332]KOY54802.1 hypothetical protein ADK59_27190 [Streptomyces sp. XY332]